MNPSLPLPEPLDEVYARITMLEFLLEVLLATDLAGADPAESERVKAELLAQVHYPLSDVTGDPSLGWHVHGVATRAAEIAADFIDRVAERERLIRERRR